MTTNTQISAVLGHERLRYHNSYEYLFRPSLPDQDILIPLCQKLKFYTTQIYYAHCHSTLFSLTSQKGTSLCTFSVPGSHCCSEPHIKLL